MSNPRVVVDPSEDLRAIAIAAGAPDPKEIIYHEDTGELEVPGVLQANLDTALATVLDGTAPVILAQITKHIEGLADTARELIENGFQSDALNLHTSLKWYDSEIEDQLNLIGNVEAGDDTVHACRDTQGGPNKVYSLHTNAQLRAVLKDGRDRKLAILQEFAIRKAQCLAATTKAELDSITWILA